MTGISLVTVVPLQSPATITDSCSSLLGWRSDPDQPQAQKQERGRTWLPQLTAAVLKKPLWMWLLLGCDQHGLCLSSGGWKSHLHTSGEFLSGAQCTSKWSPWIPRRQGSPGHTEVLLQMLKQILNPDTLRARQQQIHTTVLATRPNFTSVLLWVPKSFSGMSLNLNTHTQAKLLSYFHFYLGTIDTPLLSGLELISPPWLCHAAVITLNPRAGVSRLSLE